MAGYVFTELLFISLGLLRSFHSGSCGPPNIRFRSSPNFRNSVTTDREISQLNPSKLRKIEGEKKSEDCANCFRQQKTWSSEQLSLLRLEFVKSRILQKLQMTRPPRPKSPKTFPQPLLLAAGGMMSDGPFIDADHVDEHPHDAQVHDTTKSYIIYPDENESPFCVAMPDKPCSRFRYRLPSDIEIRGNTVSVDFWFYKLNLNALLKISEVVMDDYGVVTLRDINLEKEKNDMHLRKIKMSSITMRSESNDTRVIDFQVSCFSGCEPGYVPTVSTHKEKTPFLMLDSSNVKKLPARNRRSVDCVQGRTTCCRETLTISFAQIGWDDWIIAPRSYEANFCKGTCVSDVSSSIHHHSTVLRRFLHSDNEVAEQIGLNMCCTPSKLSPLSILYQDDNGTIIKASLPDMKVEACDCA